MKTNSISILLIVIATQLFICCKEQSSSVEYTHVTPTIVTDSVFTKRAYRFWVSDKHIGYQDFSKDEGFIKIYDMGGKFVGEAGKMGQGPSEFILPKCALYKQNSILAADLEVNKTRQTVFSLSEKGNEIIQESIELPFLNENDVTAFSTDKEGNIVIYSPNNDDILTLWDKDGTKLASGGTLPYPMTIANKDVVYTGNIYVNTHNNKLLLCLNNMPYSAVYQIENDTIKLLKEKEFAHMDYLIVDNKMQFESAGKNCMVESCLTKDYIVDLKNDPNYTGDDHSQGSPKRYTVEILDYDLNPIMLVNLGMVRFNLAAYGKDNSFFVLGANPDYCIAKVDLDECIQ